MLAFMRHPVERTLSTYRFWRGLPPPADTDDSSEAALLRAAQRATLEEFANSPHSLWWGAISNYATWLVGHGTPWNLQAPANELTPRLAQSRLASAEMVGVCERMEESLALIARSLGVPLTRATPAVNVSLETPGKNRPSSSVLRAIEDANQHDMALWETANTELDRRRKSDGRELTIVQLPSIVKERFLPKMRAHGMEILPGEDAIIGEGWLPPERSGTLSWRYAAAPGPAHVYLQWPVDGADYALLLDSPFAGKSFNYDTLRIRIDDEPVAHTCLRLLDRVVIATRPIAADPKPTRTLTFEYDLPHSAAAKQTHDQQIAFAVSLIRWIPCLDGDWRVAKEIATLATEMGDAARKCTNGMIQLEAMITKKDDYIASLTRSITEKDAYAVNLERALEAKTLEIESIRRGSHHHDAVLNR